MNPEHQNSANYLKSCNWPIAQLPGITLEEQTQLQECGINTTRQLIQQAKTPEAKIALAGKLQVNLNDVKKWVALADLARVPGVGTEYCGLLLHTGIASVAQLAQTPTHRLHQQIMRLQVATMQRRDLCPAIELIQQWSKQAKTVLNLG